MKTDTKPAARKAPVIVNAKPAAHKVTPVKAKAASAPLNLFALKEDARPTGGTTLYAHTYAAVESLGMLGKTQVSVPMSTVSALIGANAVKYHVKQGNMQSLPDGKVRVTAEGRKFFAERVASGRIKTDELDYFRKALKEGTPSRSLGITAKQLVKVSLSM
jgi:hypothetical protein